MKRLILIIAIIFGTMFFAQSQQVNFPEGNILVYSDTNNLTGGDVLIRSVYAYVPQKTSDTTYEYMYKKLYWLNDEQIKNEFISYVALSDSTILILGTPRTFEWMYEQVITISIPNWETASWQTFLQKIN